MKTILRSILGGLFASAFVVIAQAANLAPGALSAGTVKGSVTYKLAGTTEFLPLSAGTALPEGAIIKTGPESLATVVFSSGAVATITADSEIELTKFKQEVFSGPLPEGAEPSVSDTEINVIDGSVVAKVAKLKKGSSFVVKSPVGAAGVRGTTFSVSFNRATGRFTVSTLEGLVVATYTVASDGTGPQQVSTEVGDGQYVENGELKAMTPVQLSIIQAALDALPVPQEPQVQGTPGPATPQSPVVIEVDTSVSVNS